MITDRDALADRAQRNARFGVALFVLGVIMLLITSLWLENPLLFWTNAVLVIVSGALIAINLQIADENRRAK